MQIIISINFQEKITLFLIDNFLKRKTFIFHEKLFFKNDFVLYITIYNRIYMNIHIRKIILYKTIQNNRDKENIGLKKRKTN